MSHSRKGYSEAVLRQSTESLIRALENAFWHYGGVPRTLVIDNLRAAVQKADWYDPELNPKVEAFCRHYGTVILPARPYMPRHKGKVERGIGYVKGNALKGRTFGSLAEQNRHLAEWETQVAEHRIHGTTRQQVRKVFEERERPAVNASSPPGQCGRDAPEGQVSAASAAPPPWAGARLEAADTDRQPPSQCQSATLHAGFVYELLQTRLGHRNGSPMCILRPR